MKHTGMLVVSLRGVNFGFWSRLGCSGQSANILSRQGLGFREETQNYAKKDRSQIFIFLFFFSSFQRSLLRVKICLSHAHIGLFLGSQKA